MSGMSKGVPQGSEQPFNTFNTFDTFRRIRRPGTVFLTLISPLCVGRPGADGVDRVEDSAQSSLPDGPTRGLPVFYPIFHPFVLRRAGELCAE